MFMNKRRSNRSTRINVLDDLYISILIVQLIVKLHNLWLKSGR